MTSDNTRSGGIGFGGALFLLLLGLKLGHVINWSWWWVFAPFWGPVAILIAVVFVVGLIAIIFG